jgi:hypothetical protein
MALSDFNKSDVFLLTGFFSLIIFLGCLVFAGLNYLILKIQLDYTLQQIHADLTLISFLLFIISVIIGLKLDDREKMNMSKFID